MTAIGLQVVVAAVRQWIVQEVATPVGGVPVGRLAAGCVHLTIIEPPFVFAADRPPWADGGCEVHEGDTPVVGPFAQFVVGVTGSIVNAVIHGADYVVVGLPGPFGQRSS